MYICWTDWACSSAAVLFSVHSAVAAARGVLLDMDRTEFNVKIKCRVVSEKFLMMIVRKTSCPVVFKLWLFAEMAPKTKGDAKPKADKKEKKPAPKKVDASKKETKDGKAPVKAVQKALKVRAVWRQKMKL